MIVTLSLFHPGRIGLRSFALERDHRRRLIDFVSRGVERSFVACHVCYCRRAGAACPSLVTITEPIAGPATPERSSLAVNGTVTFEVNQPLLPGVPLAVPKTRVGLVLSMLMPVWVLLADYRHCRCRFR